MGARGGSVPVNNFPWCWSLLSVPSIVLFLGSHSRAETYSILTWAQATQSKRNGFALISLSPVLPSSGPHLVSHEIEAPSVTSSQRTKEVLDGSTVLNLIPLIKKKNHWKLPQLKNRCLFICFVLECSFISHMAVWRWSERVLSLQWALTATE